MSFEFSIVPASKKQVNINLVVKDELEESFSGQILSWALTYGRYIIIITQIVVLSVFFLRFKLDRDHTDLKEAVSQKQALVESIADLETDIRRIQGRLTHINQITTQQSALPKVLLFLQNNSPVNMVYSNINLTSEKINFSATAENLRSFNFLLRQLQQDKKFSEVTLEDIARQGSGRIEFKITARINIKEFI